MAGDTSLSLAYQDRELLQPLAESRNRFLDNGEPLMPFMRDLNSFAQYKPTLIGAYFLDRGYHVEYYWLTERDELLCDWCPTRPTPKDLRAFMVDGSYHRMIDAGRRAAILNGFLPSQGT